MAKFTYDILKQQVLQNGGLQSLGGASAVPVSGSVGPTEFTGTTTIDIGKYQDEVAALSFSEETDQTFDATITKTAADPSVEQLLGINDSGTNTYIPDATGGSIFLNSDRVTINAKEDFAMLFGQKGVALGSPNQVNIDSGKSITLFGHEQVFLGLPARGEEVDDTNKKRKAGKSVGDPTPDELYEPIALGIKLVNLLEDLLVTLENAEVATALGVGVFQPSTLAEFELLKVRLPEVLSNYAYLDGISHEEIDTKRLKAVKKAKAAAVDYVPPRTLTGTVTGTVAGAGAGVPPNPPNPVTNPLAQIPGFFETPPNDLYGDSL